MYHPVYFSKSSRSRSGKSKDSDASSGPKPGHHLGEDNKAKAVQAHEASMATTGHGGGGNGTESPQPSATNVHYSRGTEIQPQREDVEEDTTMSKLSINGNKGVWMQPVDNVLTFGKPTGVVNVGAGQFGANPAWRILVDVPDNMVEEVTRTVMECANKCADITSAAGLKIGLSSADLVVLRERADTYRRVFDKHISTGGRTAGKLPLRSDRQRRCKTLSIILKGGDAFRLATRQKDSKKLQYETSNDPNVLAKGFKFAGRVQFHGWCDLNAFSESTFAVKATMTAGTFIPCVSAASTFDIDVNDLDEGDGIV